MENTLKGVVESRLATPKLARSLLGQLPVRVKVTWVTPLGEEVASIS